MLFSADIPKFDGVVDFACWYLRSYGLPVFFNTQTTGDIKDFRVNVYCSYDGTSTALFRHGQYEIEMYLIHPEPLIPAHSHPGVDTVEFGLHDLLRDDIEDSLLPFLKDRLLFDGQTHGPDIRMKGELNGYTMFSAQKWRDDLTPTTVSARWRGQTAGPKHEELIRRINPGCLCYSGYADVTKQAEFMEIL